MKICEILGAEPNIKFNIRDDTRHIVYKDAYITYNGIVSDCNGNTIDAYALCKLINGFYAIDIKPRLTESEIALCKTFNAKYVAMDEISDWVTFYTEKPILKDFYYASKSENQMAILRPKFMPSIEPGDCICVEDYIK